MTVSESGLYPYCDDCPIKFYSRQEKLECGLYWRPLTGTKIGFPINGWNCPKDFEQQLIDLLNVNMNNQK